MSHEPSKIAVLTSGGVDSSVALALLKQAGHDVTAFYLKIWLEDELSYLGDCPWQEDLSFVEQVCKQLEVPLEVLSLQKEYWDAVVGYAIGEVKAGRTPNPDMLCNQRVKFGVFYDRIDPSFDKVATGHYAQVIRVGTRRALSLQKAPDPVKDQTYFLAYLNQQQLSRALFPIGAYTKPEVRVLAKQFDLPNKDRKDSQGICFLGKIPYDEFIRHHFGEQAGDLVELETGEVKGQHEGYWYYTLGQRKGIHLHGGPWYVVKKDLANNKVYISRDYRSEDKPRDEFQVASCNWISGQRPEVTILQVKVRHGKEAYNCQINWVHGDVADVKIDGQDQGLSPGQFAVFYDGEICLGGGVIQ